MLSHPVDKSSSEKFVDLKGIFEKTLAVNKDMKEGDILRFCDLEGKKPSGMGVSAKDYKMVLGKPLLKGLKKWAFVEKGDLGE